MRHRHPGLRQHAAHRRVMEQQLPGNGADRPVLDVIEAQYLGFLRATDHAPSRSAEAPTAPSSQSRELWQWRVAKIAVPDHVKRVGIAQAQRGVRDIED